MAELELFADLLGQPRAVALLEATLRRQHLAPAYLFAGPEGVGRRLATRRFLEGIHAGADGSAALRRRLCQGNHPDLLWVEPTYLHQGRLVPASRAVAEGVNRRTPPQLRLEQVREVSRFLARTPLETDRPLVVLEDAEAMAEAAANALLKTLEEPGDGVLILITSMPERLLSTIRSRCQLIPFTRLAPEAMHLVLEQLGGGDQEDVASEPSSCQGAGLDPPELLQMAAGSPGALVALREQWHALPEGLADRLLRLERDPMAALDLARELCEALDGEQQLWLLDWWQWTLWRRRGIEAEVRRIEGLRRHLLAYVQPRLAWEVALLELVGAAHS
jgi:DNA polymerase-3 subunit delta'